MEGSVLCFDWDKNSSVSIAIYYVAFLLYLELSSLNLCPSQKHSLKYAESANVGK